MKDSICEEGNFNRVFTQHAEQIRNFLYYKCGDLNEAEDLMQDAFIKLWDNCKKVIPEKVKGFLFTIANRLFLNRVEHKKVVLTFEKQTGSDRNIQSPEFLLLEREFQSQLENAISSLPETQREVFLMNRIDNMSFQEIADIQGVSIGAVHKKMYKAMDKLKSSIDILNQRKI